MNLEDRYEVFGAPPEPEVVPPTQEAAPTETPVETSTETEGEEGLEAGSEELAEGANEDPSEKDEKKKTGSQRAREALQREREERIRLETENKLLREMRENKPQVPEVPIQATEEREPNQDDFPDFMTYTKAVARWEIRQEMKAQENQRIQQARRGVWEQKVEEGKGKYDNFEALFQTAEIPPKPIADLICGPKVPVEVVHYLLTHPEKQREINRMSIDDAAFELGALKISLSAPAKPEPPKPRTTQAPAPVAPLTSVSPVVPKAHRSESYVVVQ